MCCFLCLPAAAGEGIVVTTPMFLSVGVVVGYPYPENGTVKIGAGIKGASDQVVTISAHSHLNDHLIRLVSE